MTRGDPDTVEDQVAKLLDARVVNNKELQTIDLNVVKSNEEVAGSWGNKPKPKSVDTKESLPAPPGKDTLRIHGKVDEKGNYTIDIWLQIMQLVGYTCCSRRQEQPLGLLFSQFRQLLSRDWIPVPETRRFKHYSSRGP